MSARAGTELGPFRLVAPIGRGGTAEVWRATHPSGLEVAIKLLASPRDPDALAREARAVARLRHPHIVVLYELGEAEGTPFLAMELAAGTLADRVGTLSWDALIPTLEALLQALAHAHAAGVVHRDLKPSNVLLHDDGRPVLADFGIASAVGRDDRGGTPAYAAPEQLTGGVVGPAADLFSLGCLTWTMVTGRAPWQARAPGEPLPALPHDAPAPSDLWDWLAWLTADAPAARPVFAADALAALRELSPTAGGAPSAAAWDDAATRAAAPLSLPGTHQARSRRTFLRDRSTRLAAPLLPTDPEPAPLPAPSGTAPPLPASWPPDPPVAEPPRGLGLSLVALRTLPLVGRGAARAHLWDALRDLAAGTSRVVWLTGDAGCGRGHLAERVRHEAHARGVAVSGTLRPTVSPADAASALAEAAGTRGVVARVQAAPGLSTWLEALLGVAELPPTLVLVHANEAPGEVDDVVVLAPLSVEHTRRIAERHLGLQGPAADAIVARADGNPGLAVQLVRDWVHRGVLRGTDTGFEQAPGASVPAPDAITEPWSHRLDALDEDAVRALEIAALLGSPVSARDWRAAGPSEATLSALEAAGLITADGGGWRLHPGLREAVEQRARDAGRWSETCGRVRRWLGDRDDLEDDAGALTVFARALAGENRGLQGAAALGRAARLLRRARLASQSNALLLRQRRLLDVVGVDAGHEQRIVSAHQLALNAAFLGRPDEALAWVETARQAEAARKDDQWRAKHLSVHGEVLGLAGRWREAAPRFAESETLLRAAGRRHDAADAATSRGHAAYNAGRLDEARSHLERAVDDYEAIGDDLGGKISLVSVLLQLDPAAAEALLDHLEPALRAAGRTNELATVHNQRANLALARGDLVERRRHLEAAVALLEPTGSGRLPFFRLLLAQQVGLEDGWERARERFVEVEPECRGRYRAFWLGASFPALVLDEDFEAHLRAAAGELEDAGMVLGHGASLEAAAARAEAAGRTARAEACRALAARWENG